MEHVHTSCIACIIGGDLSETDLILGIEVHLAVLGIHFLGDFSEFQHVNRFQAFQTRVQVWVNMLHRRKKPEVKLGQVAAPQMIEELADLRLFAGPTIDAY